MKRSLVFVSFPEPALISEELVLPNVVIHDLFFEEVQPHFVVGVDILVYRILEVVEVPRGIQEADGHLHLPQVLESILHVSVGVDGVSQVESSRFALAASIPARLKNYLNVGIIVLALCPLDHIGAGKTYAPGILVESIG